MQSYIKENPFVAIGALILVAGVAMNSGSIQDNREFATQLREERTQASRQLAAQEQENQEAQRLSEIAVERYEQGCLLVVSTADPSRAVSIIEGEPVVDPTTGAPLPNATVVCDVHGNTGIMQNGVVALVAYTGKVEPVRIRIEEMGFDANIFRPAQ